MIIKFLFCILFYNINLYILSITMLSKTDIKIKYYNYCIILYTELQFQKWKRNVNLYCITTEYLLTCN